VDTHNLAFILLNFLEFRDNLKLVSYNFLEMDSKLSSQEIWVVVIVLFLDWNFWEENREVFNLQFTILHVNDGDLLVPLQSDDTHGEEEHDEPIKDNDHD